MATSLFDSAPEYDSDLDTLDDFVIEPTTVHVPPPPSPAPNTCLCGRTTRDDDSDEPLYCSEICARLDAFHALTARSRSNSLAPTPVTTAPATPLGAHMALRESLAGLFGASDPMSALPFIPTPLSESPSLASVDSAGLPIEMSSHYRRVYAKRERMERRASEERERSRSHSRTHSKASNSLERLAEECHIETCITREGSDGEDHVPTPATFLVHVAVNIQVVHQERNDEDEEDHVEDSETPAAFLGPALGVEWHDPFANSIPISSSHASSLAPQDASDPCREADDVLSITESELVGDLSPFVAYAPVSAPPTGLRTRKSSVCFAGVGPAGQMESMLPSRASSDTRSRSASVTALVEKPLPPTPELDQVTSALKVSESDSAVELSMPTEAETLEPKNPLPSPALTLDAPSMSSLALESTEPTTPTSSTAPASPRTPNARIHESEGDALATPSRSASAPATQARASSTLRRSPGALTRPATSQRTQRPDTLDAVDRANIFSMVIDPDLDVFSGEIVEQNSAAPPLKRSDTAPELATGWGSQPQTPRMDTQVQNRARAASTPRRPGVAGRPRTTSTPPRPGMLQLVPKTARRARMHVPPPTPPVSPAHVSSPRPSVSQDPGSWPSFGAVFDAWGWNGKADGEGLHRRQESGESTGSSATDVSWDTSSGAPLSSVYSWPTDGDAVTEYEADGWSSALRARSPATSSVRTIVPPPRNSSLGGDEKEDHMNLHLCHPRRSRRHSSIAALDSILAMEDTFWATEAVVVREAEECVDDAGEGVGVGTSHFSGDAGGFAFPCEKAKVPFQPVLRIAGLSRPSSMANLLNDGPRSRRGSGVRFGESTDHRPPTSQFPASPLSASARPGREGDTASLLPPYPSGSLFDAPMTASPLSGSPALSRCSPALPNASPVLAHFGLRTPSSPYLSVPSRRGSRSADASSVLMRTASAARLAVALNAAQDDDDDERFAHDEPLYARYSPGSATRVRRSGSLGHSSPLGLGLALGISGDEHSRARANSESWVGAPPASVLSPTSGTMSRSGSRMNLMNPTTSILLEEEEEEDYGEVVDDSKFAGIAELPTTPSVEQSGKASPLIDAFPHPMGGYFPGSRFASRAGTPVRSLHTSNSALSLRQVAMGTTNQIKPETAESEDEDEEIVTTVQRIRNSMQLLTTV